MTKEQIDFVFNKYGGREKVIGTMLFEVYFDNPRNFIPDGNATKEERLESIKFDDASEMVIILEKNRLYNATCSYTPTVSRIFIPYDDIQGIYVCEDIADIKLRAETKSTK